MTIALPNLRARSSFLRERNGEQRNGEQRAAVSGGGDNKDGGFTKMGERRLKDDVVDMVFTTINNGKPLGDKVDGNDKPFGNQFPFVAKPN